MMIKPNLEKWEYKPELEGLLFFAQSIQEMLFHHTVDTYKAPAQNVHSTLFELMHVAKEVKNKHIRDANLNYVIEELSIRLREDPVLGSDYINTYKYYIEEINNSIKDPSVIIKYCGSLLALISGYYWDNLNNSIVQKIRNPSLKKDIYALAASFIAEAELNRFSREYIYYFTNQFFFEDKNIKISSVDQVKDFLAAFQTKSSGWQVFFKGSSNYEELTQVTKKINSEERKVEIDNKKPNDLDPKILGDQFFRPDPAHPQFIRINLSEGEGIKEPISARDSAKDTLNLLSTIYSFITHKEIVDIHDQSLILNVSSGKTCSLKEPIHQMKCGIQRLTPSNLEGKIDLYLDIINQLHFGQNSTYQIFRSISFHHAALESNFVLNQLVDLWSSLEGLLPDPDEYSSRIEYYLDCLLPAQVLTYPMKIFSDVSEDLSHEPELKRIINEIDIEGEFINKVIELLVISEFGDIRKQIYSRLDHHPLLRNRICLINQSFNSKKHIRNTLLQHRDKIKRHIQRIYNCRNQIVHSASTLPYISTLVENLHFYIDTLIDSMLNIAVESKTRLSISSAIGILSVKEKQLFDILDGEDEGCSKDCYKKYLWLK